MIFRILLLLLVAGALSWWHFALRDNTEATIALQTPTSSAESTTATGTLATSSPVTSTSTLATPEPVPPPSIPVPEPKPAPVAPQPSTPSPTPEPVVDIPPIETVTTPIVLSAATTLEWGTYVGYTPADLEAFETMVGEEVDIRAIFVNWYEPFPTSVAQHLKSEQKTLLLFWEHHGVTLDSIVAGEQDEYIEEFAQAAKASGVQLIMSPLHEMNGNWDPWNGTVGNNTPEKVILAWRRMFDIFDAGSNISFAWTVNNVSVPNTPENQLENYYPGDEYVDIVGVDGFNFGRPWRWFDQVFAEVLSRLKQYDKPIYILSTATAEGGRKPAWIYDFGARLAEHPEVEGWVWFHIDKERDWRVNSDPASLEAFKTIIP